MWGLTEGERKRTGTDPVVLPRVVVYDPELTVSLPAGLSAASRLERDGALRGGVLGAATQSDQLARR